MAASDGWVVANAINHVHPRSDEGAEYVYAVGGEDCNRNRELDVCDIVEGTSPDRNDNGIPDECDHDSDGDGVLDSEDVCPDSGDAGYVDEEGRPIADFNGDCRIDLWDFGVFQFVFNGP